MEIRFEGNETLEAVTRIIFDPERDLDRFQRLYLQTWFVRLGDERAAETGRLIDELITYMQNREPSPFLQGLAAGHPRFMEWFGDRLLDQPAVGAILEELAGMNPFPRKPAEPDFVGEARGRLTPLRMADRLQEIVGEPYPKPDGPIRCILSAYPPSPYNVYPDTVVHDARGNVAWYVGSFGHEAGHILTWEFCRDPRVRELCRNEVTRGFSERLGELCCKLLLDACGYTCREAFPECVDWEHYMYEKNPGKPLFEAMVAEIRSGSYSSLRAECLRILERFQ